MKKLLGFLCTVALVFGMVGVANALPYLDVNGDHSGSVWMGTLLNPAETWIFDLDDDMLDIGDINAGDTILSAKLTINITDNDPDDNEWWKFEFADLGLDGTNIYNDVEVDPGVFSIDVIAFVADHQLNVTIDDIWGNFWVNEISIVGDYETAPVPEPATILLVGTGLLGIIGFGRKRFNKKA